jgi:glutamyl-tRNA reductase
MRIGVLGLNHKIADLRLREAIAKACQRGFGDIGAEIQDGAYVVISTCNRTEVYFCSADLAESHSYILDVLRQDLEFDFEHRLYSYFGYDCFHHLARVTAGLDSAITGETEIQGQVKGSYELACQRDRVPPMMHFSFQKALKIGKTVRSRILKHRAQYDLEHAVLAAARHYFEDVGARRLLFVGASEINYKIFSYLQGSGIEKIALCNRSRSHALAFANEEEVDHLSWDELDEWRHFDWIIFGTKCPDFVLAREDLRESLPGGRLLIDLSVPRNVDPHVGRHAQISLLNIDQVNRMVRHKRRKLDHAVANAEEMVGFLSKRYADIHHEKEKARQHRIAVGA